MFYESSTENRILAIYEVSRGNATTRGRISSRPKYNYHSKKKRKVPVTYFNLCRKYTQILRAKEIECSESINPSGYFLICYKVSYTLVPTQGFKSIYASRLLCYRFHFLVYIEKICKAFWFTKLALGLCFYWTGAHLQYRLRQRLSCLIVRVFSWSPRSNSCITNYIATIFFCIHVLFIP